MLFGNVFGRQMGGPASGRERERTDVQLGGHHHVLRARRLRVHVLLEDVRRGLLRVEHEDALAGEVEVHDGACATVRLAARHWHGDMMRTVLLAPLCILQPLLALRHA